MKRWYIWVCVRVFVLCWLCYCIYEIQLPIDTQWCDGDVGGGDYMEWWYSDIEMLFTAPYNELPTEWTRLHYLHTHTYTQCIGHWLELSNKWARIIFLNLPTCIALLSIALHSIALLCLLGHRPMNIALFFDSQLRCTAILIEYWENAWLNKKKARAHTHSFVHSLVLVFVLFFIGVIVVVVATVNDHTRITKRPLTHCSVWWWF